MRRYFINIYDVTTGLVINTQQGVYSNSFNMQIRMSSDGRYLAVGNNQATIDIYELKNFAFSKITTFTNPYISSGFRDVYFHPNNPDQINIAWVIGGNYNTTINTHQLPQEIQLQSINVSGFNRIFSIDPVTEFAAYLNGSDKFVIAPLSDLNNQLYTFIQYFTSSTGSYLYNGCLFSSNGYAANIMKELLQP